MSEAVPALDGEFAGAVLAGGRSRRFGHDKCGHLLDGLPLVDHALRSLEGARERWIVGGPRRERDGVGWIRDEPPGRGPLAGLAAAFGRVRQPWVAIVACDMPFVPPQLWPRLFAYAARAKVVMPEGPNGLEPTAAIYHRDLASQVDRFLASGTGSPRALLEQHGIVVRWHELYAVLPPNAFHNVNRQEDLP